LPVQATGVGSLSTVHFQSGPIRSIEDLSSDPEARTLFQLDLLARGIYSPRRNMVNLSLPMSDADIDGFVAVFEEFLDGRGPLSGG
jgi:glutamate-1-semialdehyde 2,1-aminomutase